MVTGHQKWWPAPYEPEKEKAMNTTTRMLHTWWEQNLSDLIWTALIAAAFCAAVLVRW
jgi:hypothetical protein